MNLDMYKFIPEKIKSHDNLICLARFFYLWPPVLDAPTYGALPRFQYEPKEATLPLEPFVDLDCEYSGDYNYFDPMSEYTGIPNTFIDATGPADDLRPRMQLIEPSNPFLTRYHRIEEWCEMHPEICSDLDDPSNKSAFMSEFNIADYEPSEQITPRHRSDVPWESSKDVGPWQKPHLTAGMDTMVKILIRREQEWLPTGKADAVCLRDYFDNRRNIAWLVYTDSSSITHDPEVDDPAAIINAHEAGILPPPGNPSHGKIVLTPCYKTLQDILEAASPPPYLAYTLDWFSDHNLSNLEGTTY
jgi:hypothetical protein